MVNVDISNIWCSVSLTALLEAEAEIAAAHAALTDGPRADFLSWLDGSLDGELERVRQAAEAIRETSQVLVVVGGGSAAQGARAVLELAGGRGLTVLFTGGDLSTAAWQALSEQLEGRDFSVQLLGRSGADLPAAVAARSLRWLLERRYGTEKARERVYVTTDPAGGPLRTLSAAEGYTAFNLPAAPGGGESPLCPGALLGPAAAGVDAAAALGAAAALRPQLQVRSFDNPAWLYAAGRTVLARKGKRVEYLTTGEPEAAALCRWWQGLFGGRGCLGGDGLLPAVAAAPADLTQMAPVFSDGANPVVQTFLRFAPPAHRVPVEMDWQNFDGLNYLEGYTLDFVQEQALAGAVQWGADGGVPTIMMDGPAPSAEAAGELLYFFELAGCLAAGMLGRDVYEPAEKPGWAVRAEALLGRPEDDPASQK